MMIIKNDDYTFQLPLENGYPTLLIAEKNKDILVDLLNSYFNLKRKTKCNIFEDDETIKMNDINFIYFSDSISFDNNMLFKNKTIINEEISKLIIESPEYFKSIELIRNGLKELLTDNGFNRIRKIVSDGLNKTIDIQIESFSINDILSMLSIDLFNLKDDEKKVIILNLLLYVNRKNTNLIFIDTDITQLMENVISKTAKNNYFIINNDKISSISIKYNVLMLNNTDILEVSNELFSDIRLISFASHDIILKNLDLINNKNIHKISKYKDKNCTFFVKSVN